MLAPLDEGGTLGLSHQKDGHIRATFCPEGYVFLILKSRHQC